MRSLHLPLWVIAFFFMKPLSAQNLDSIIGLNEVTVTGSRFKHFNTGYFYTTIDSTTKSTEATRYLGDLLTQTSLFQINNYGTGAISVSARGMGEKRTPVVWNGFNIQNIMTTGIDLGQLPSFFFENIHSQMGGSSALFGSGAAGGVLFLNNKQIFGKGFGGQILTHTGSFGNYYGGSEINTSGQYYSVSLKGFYNTIKNNFPYHADYYGQEIDTTQTNATAKQYGLMMNNAFKLSHNQILHVNLWYTESNKSIAPTLYDVSSHAVGDGSQSDDFYAISGEYVYQFENISLNARSGIFNSITLYEKPSWGQVSDNKALWWINEFEGSANLGQYIKINSGINLTHERARSTSFTHDKMRSREAVFASFKFIEEDLGIEVSTNFRGEAISGDWGPLTYSFGAAYQPVNLLTLKGNIARNYRLPSFNDLYYKDAWSEGNPSLVPEYGMNYEFGFEFGIKNKERTALLGINGFHSLMDNWMNWAQREDMIWSVFNIDKAKITGLESSLELGINKKKVGINSKIMYTKTHAKDRNTSNFIPYVPAYKTASILQLRVFNSSLAYHFTQIGKRYTSADNAGSLDSYNISNIILSQAISFEQIKYSLDFGVYNLFNKDYMIISEYPMPRRNFRFGLRINF